MSIIMSIIMKEDHLKIIRKIKKRHLTIHLLGTLLVLIILSFIWFKEWENRVIRETFSVFKAQYISLLSKQQLYTLLRNKALTVGQSLDVAEAILGQNRVPISIALGMISLESDFNPNAISKAGARGLTQVMPIIREIYSKSPLFGKEILQTHEVSVNVKLGLTFLGDLYGEYKDWKKALRAYNAGPENANNAKYDGYANTVLRKAKEFNYILGLM